MTILTEILDEIKKYETIIIHRHLRPDPDAIGSQMGLKAILKASFPTKKVYGVGGPVEGLDYLAVMDDVLDTDYAGALVICTDTANAPRVSDQRYQSGAKVIKIDHHPNDEPYGDLAWVKTSASSCSEMIYDFYSEFADELVLTDDGARLLYAGIVGDTGRFLYPSTSAHTFEVAAELRQFDFDAAHLNRQIEQISTAVAKLSGYVLENLKIDENGAGMVILPQSLLLELGIVDAETAAVVPLPGQIDIVNAWGIFVEQPEGYYRVRLRSKGAVINEIAKGHHGGGHPLASGANARDLTEVAAIYRELQAVVKV